MIKCWGEGGGGAEAEGAFSPTGIVDRNREWMGEAHGKLGRKGGVDELPV